MLRRKKFFIGGLVLFLAIGYLGYTGFINSARYYYTVPELMSQAGSLQGVTVRVNGLVDAGSVEREAGGKTMRFSLVDSGRSVIVVYEGVVPDTFKAGNEVVVEGVLNSSGIFEANNILTKCASKYAPG